MKVELTEDDIEIIEKSFRTYGLMIENLLNANKLTTEQKLLSIDDMNVMKNVKDKLNIFLDSNVPPKS